MTERNNFFTLLKVKETFDKELDSYIFKNNKDEKIFSKNEDLVVKEEYKELKVENYSLAYIKGSSIDINKYTKLLNALSESERINKANKILSELKYKITGVSKILESVFEYMPLDIIIKFFYEGLKETFLCNKGCIFKLDEKNKYKSYYGEDNISFVCKECSDAVRFSFPINLRLQNPYFINDKIKNIFRKRNLDLIIPIASEDKNSFIIALSGSNIRQEDMELINLSGTLFNKALRLQKLITDNKKITEEISIRSFEMLSLLEGAKLVLSSKDYNELSSKTGDMLMEIFQNEWNTTFLKKGDILEFRFYRSIKGEKCKFRSIIQKKTPSKHIFLESEIEDLYDFFDLPEIIKNKNPVGAILYGNLENIKGITIFGKSISGFDFKSEDNITFIETVRNTVETAIENINFIDKIKEARDRAEAYLDIIKSIFELGKVLDRTVDVEEVIKLIKIYLENNFQFSGVKIVLEDSNTNKNEILNSKALSVPIIHDGITMGHISCKKRKGLPINSEENFLILNILAEELSPYLVLKKITPKREYLNMNNIFIMFIESKIKEAEDSYYVKPYLYLLDKKPQSIVGFCLKIDKKYLYISPEELKDIKTIKLEELKVYVKEKKLTK